MVTENDPLAVDRRFFTALVAADREALAEVLADDFVLVDVMSGGEVTKAVLIEAIAAGQLAFASIEPADPQIRRYGTAAVIVGSTQMKGRFGVVEFALRSRYTHVFAQLQGRWRLVSAQGTQIRDATGPASVAGP